MGRGPSHNRKGGNGVYTPDDVKRWRQMRKAGKKLKEIVAEEGVSMNTLHRLLSEEEA
jgi:hypothetical protein